MTAFKSVIHSSMYRTAGYGPSCGCGYMCYCNRRIIRGMVSVVDAMVANLTTALQSKGMWESTIFVFLGDNGAPNNNAGSNGIYKGMKFGHYEGTCVTRSTLTLRLLFIDDCNQLNHCNGRNFASTNDASA